MSYFGNLPRAPLSRKFNDITSLRFFEPSEDGEVVYLAGHTELGKGEGNFVYVAEDATSADDNGMVVVTPKGARWKREYNGTIYASWYGAINDGETDNTAAIQAALDYQVPDDNVKVVHLGSGRSMCNNVQMRNLQKSSLIGDTTRGCQLIYNGPQAPGTSIVRMENQSFGEISGISFLGYDVYNPGALTRHMSEHCVIQDGFVDLLFEMRDFAVGACYGDAVVLSPDSTVNTVLSHFRSDAIGGYVLRVGGSIHTEQRPIHINTVTWDNIATSIIYDKLLELGAITATAAGKGFLLVNDGRGVEINIRGARMELNMPLNTDKPCLVRSNNTISGSYTEINLDNVIGFFNAAQSQKYSPIVWADVGRTTLATKNSSMITYRSVYNEATGLDEGSVGVAQELMLSTSNQQQRTGIDLYGQRIGAANNATFGASFDLYTGGSLFLYKEFNNAFHDPLQIVSWPTSGEKAASRSDVVACSNMSGGIGDTVMTMAADTARLPVTKSQIVIPGGGVASADLTTRVETVDFASKTFTISTALSTAVTDVSAKYAVIVRKNVGMMRARQRNYTQTNPNSQSGFYNSNRGDMTISSNPDARWFPSMWQCTGDGSDASSGSWKVAQAINGTTANRTTLTPLLTSRDAGVVFFDTDLGKPAFFDGTGWVDATGIAL